MVSKEYREGMKARSHGDNPYDKNSSQYDDFERGATQKLKRMPDSAFRNDLKDSTRRYRSHFEDKRSDVPEWKPNSYAEARQK